MGIIGQVDTRVLNRRLAETIMRLNVGNHVKVGPFKLDGRTPHPMAGVTGEIIEMMYLRGVAQVRVDNGHFSLTGTIMFVSFDCLERIA